MAKKDTDQGDEGSGADDDQQDDGDSSTGGLSQEEVTRIAAKEKREGKRAGQRELLESLGVEDPESAKELIERARQQLEEEKDERTKSAEAQAAAERKAEQAAKTADAARHEVNVIKGLVRAGADTETVDDLVPLVKADVGAETDDIAAAVSDLKKKFPALFEKQSSNDGDDEDDSDSGGKTGGGTPDSSVGGGKKGTKKPGTAEERAKERFQKNFADKLPAKSDA